MMSVIKIHECSSCGVVSETLAAECEVCGSAAFRLRYRCDHCHTMLDGIRCPACTTVPLIPVTLPPATPPAPPSPIITPSAFKPAPNKVAAAFGGLLAGGLFGALFVLAHGGIAYLLNRWFGWTMESWIARSLVYGLFWYLIGCAIASYGSLSDGDRVGLVLGLGIFGAFFGCITGLIGWAWTGVALGSLLGLLGLLYSQSSE